MRVTQREDGEEKEVSSVWRICFFPAQETIWLKSTIIRWDVPRHFQERLRYKAGLKNTSTTILLWSDLCVYYHARCAQAPVKVMLVYVTDHIQAMPTVWLNMNFSPIEEEYLCGFSLRLQMEGHLKNPLVFRVMLSLPNRSAFIHDLTIIWITEVYMEM